jgi:WD40 repeat protein
VARRLVIADDAEIQVFDLRTREGMHALAEWWRNPHARLTPDGTHLAAGCHDKQVRVWRVADGELVMVIPQEQAFVSGGRIAFTSDGKYLIDAGC